MVAVVLAMSFVLGSCTDAEVASQNLSKAVDQTTEAPMTTVVETTTTTAAPTTTTAAPTTTTLRPEDQYLREARSRFTGGDDEIYLALGDLACTVLSLSDVGGDFEGAALMSLIVAEAETELPPEVIGEATLLASQHLCSEYEGISEDIVDLYLSVASSEEDEGASESGLTRSQENAIRKAESYLDFMAFSRTGLIEQLEYEGFDTDE